MANSEGAIINYRFQKLSCMAPFVNFGVDDRWQCSQILSYMRERADMSELKDAVIDGFRIDLFRLDIILDEVCKECT